MIVTIQIAIVVLLLLINGFFAMSELAVVSARRGRLQQLANEGHSGAAVALALAEEPGRFLSSVQIGITLVGILAGAFSGATLADKLGDVFDGVAWIQPYGDMLAIGLVVVLITFASVVLGELVPKQIALGNAERIAARVARPMALVAHIGAPIVAVLQWSTLQILQLLGIREIRRSAVTEEEVTSLIAEGTESGVFAAAEKEMIEGILGLADQSVRAIMTPRPDVIWIDPDDDPGTIKREIISCPYSRIVVSRESLDDILGIVQKKDLLETCLLDKSFDLKAAIVKPLTVPGTTTVLSMLEVFKTTPIHFAFVVNEYGSLQGVVTLTDILTAIAGDIREHPGDATPSYVRRDDGSYLMDGRMPIHEAQELLGLRQLPSAGGYYTLAGLALARFGRVPAEGDRFTLEDWRIEVIDMDGNRIDKLLAVRRDAPKTPALSQNLTEQRNV